MELILIGTISKIKNPYPVGQKQGRDFILSRTLQQ